jgi:uncharacterized protein YxeA
MKKIGIAILIVVLLAAVIAAIYFYKTATIEKAYMEIKDSLETSLVFCSTKYVYEEIITRTEKTKMGKEARVLIKVNGEIIAGSEIINVAKREDEFRIRVGKPKIVSHDVKVVEDHMINRLFNKISPDEFVNIINEQKILLEEKLKDEIIDQTKEDYQKIVSRYQNEYKNLRFTVEFLN